MTGLTIEESLEKIYTSLENDNDEIDTHIKELKETMSKKNEKTVEVDTKRLAQNNRQGRKLMQSYFRKRGVNITFTS